MEGKGGEWGWILFASFLKEGNDGINVCIYIEIIWKYYRVCEFEGEDRRISIFCR